MQLSDLPAVMRELQRALQPTVRRLAVASAVFRAEVVRERHRQAVTAQSRRE